MRHRSARQDEQATRPTEITRRFPILLQRSEELHCGSAFKGGKSGRLKKDNGRATDGAAQQRSIAGGAETVRPAGTLRGGEDDGAVPGGASERPDQLVRDVIEEGVVRLRQASVIPAAPLPPLPLAEDAAGDGDIELRDLGRASGDPGQEGRELGLGVDQEEGDLAIEFVIAGRVGSVLPNIQRELFLAIQEGRWDVRKELFLEWRLAVLAAGLEAGLAVELGVSEVSVKKVAGRRPVEDFAAYRRALGPLPCCLLRGRAQVHILQVGTTKVDGL